MATLISKSLLQLLLILIITALATFSLKSQAADYEEPNSNCKAWLVQSIPTDMPDLPRVPGVLPTDAVLRWIAGNASESLDILAQYWEFLPDPVNNASSDYGYSEEELKKFGADAGISVYHSLETAADRNVHIRIVQHSGFSPVFDEESANLAKGRSNVENVTLLLTNWFGSGIVHAKVWMADSKHAYIGSANNDWKSLTQVKELGIYLVDCPTIVKKVETYFENLYTLSKLNATKYTKNVFDGQSQINRKVPCWSHYLNETERCTSPLPEYIKTPNVLGYPSITEPDMLHVSIDTPEITYNSSMIQPSYVSFAPPELLFERNQPDIQGWVDTIKSVPVGGTVRMNTMDWLGQSQFLNPPVYWDELSSAISEVVLAKNGTVKLIVAYWAHSLDGADQYLKSLLYTNVLCNSSLYNHCGGKVEIKYYMVPGFNSTGPAILKGNKTGFMYPDFTRVNHGKYVVSNVRANIGTSNLIWDYFYVTSGVSFGTYHSAIVKQLQAIFDADWYSPYAVPVVPLK